MCTAISLSRGNGFFGRTLDLEYHYNESVTITPPDFLFRSPSGYLVQGPYAMIGMATVIDGYPLYYDAMNSHGLCMAALHFPGNGVYLEPCEGKENLPPYALIPRILSSCATLAEAKAVLSNLCLINRPFSQRYPLTPLHWMISQNGQSIVVEPMADGVRVCENPVSVMTNNPAFDAQFAGLLRYNGLSPQEPATMMIEPSLLPPPFRGLGAVGLPGDYSSPSRFVRAVFLRQNTPTLSGDDGVISFFRMMEGVSIPKGGLLSHDGKWVHTIYTSCCDPQTRTYYYTAYTNPTIIGIKLSLIGHEQEMISIPLRWKDEIIMDSTTGV